MSSVIWEDFPYIPNKEHVDALNDFCELDHTLLQQSDSIQRSPRSPKSGNARSKGKNNASKKKTLEENAIRIMSGSYHAKGNASPVLSRKMTRVFAIIGKSGSGKTSLLQYWSDERKINAKSRSLLSKSPTQSHRNDECLILPGKNATNTPPQVNRGVANEFVFTYFVRSSQDELLSNMLLQLESALKSHFQLRQLELRKTPSQLRWDLPRFLDAANKKSRAAIIIVIDGLSRLRMHNGQEADPMLWMPRDLPSRVRFLVSLTEYTVPPIEEEEGSQGDYQIHSPGATSFDALQKKTASYCELERRKAPSLRLGILRLSARKNILSTYSKFHRSAFELTSEKMTQILASPDSGHPLYLRVLLNSLRTTARLSCIPTIAVGSLLDQCIDAHHSVGSNLISSRSQDHAANSSQPSSAVEFVISLALRRCEEDVEVASDGSDKGLLGRVLSLLYVSHHGLTEDELLGIVAMSEKRGLSDSNENSNRSMQAKTTDFVQQFEQHRDVLRLILDDICMVVRAPTTLKSAGTNINTPEIHEKSPMQASSSEDPSEMYKRSMRIIMEHESVRRVIWRQYLGCSHDERKRNHRLLALYFEEVVHVSPRRVQELPWHYEKLGEFFHLRNTVVDVEMFKMWWGDPHLEAYRIELIRVWSVLAASPIGLDMVDEYRVSIESYILSSGWNDKEISNLMLQVAEMCVAFNRAGWEGQSSAQCPTLKHPNIPLQELVQNGICIVRPDVDAEESGDVSIFVDLLSTRANFSVGTVKSQDATKDQMSNMSNIAVQQQLAAAHKAQQVTPQTIDFVRNHYYYSRWMWIQFPIVLLGYFDRYVERIQATAKAKSAPAISKQLHGNGKISKFADKNKLKASPKRKDPIIMYLQRLANKFESGNGDINVDDYKDDAHEKTSDIIMTTPLRSRRSRKGHSAPPPAFLTANPDDEDKDIKTIGENKPGDFDDGSTSHSKSNSRAFQQKGKQHPNAPFFLDVHAGDRHRKRIQLMKENHLKQRRQMNQMIIKAHQKKKVLHKKKEELTILNGLSKGEKLSLTVALNLVSELESIGKRTNKVYMLSDFYKMVLLLTKAYPGNQPEWLDILDEEVEKSQRKIVQTRELIVAIKRQGKDIQSLLSDAQTANIKRSDVVSQMLERMEFQHAKELANVRNEYEWKQRQARLLDNDIKNEKRKQQLRAQEEAQKRQAENELKRQVRERKLAVWKARITKLKESTGVSSMDEMFSIISSGTQMITQQNLQSLVSENETKIQKMSVLNKSLRNEFQKLKFSSNQGLNQASIARKVSSNSSQNDLPIQSYLKKELHKLAEAELALGQSKLKIEHTKRELHRSKMLITDINAGIEHILLMCGPTESMDAETKREMQSLVEVNSSAAKQKGLYFEASKDLSGFERANLALKRLIDLEGRITSKIVELQRIAPRTPKSRSRKLRNRSNSRQSLSRDGRVGSPLSRETTALVGLRPASRGDILSRGSSSQEIGSSRPWTSQSMSMSRADSRPISHEGSSDRASTSGSRGSSRGFVFGRPVSRQGSLSRQSSFRAMSRPSTQDSLFGFSIRMGGSIASRSMSKERSRPDTPETDEDYPYQSGSSSNLGGSKSNNRNSSSSEAMRKRSLLRRMWPRIIQTNDAAILKAKNMAKTHSLIGKDLSEVQSSLWQSRATKLFPSIVHSNVESAAPTTLENSNFPDSLVVSPLKRSGTTSDKVSGMFGSSVRREVFVDLEALNRPVSADVSGNGTDLPVVSMKRRFMKFSSSSASTKGDFGTVDDEKNTSDHARHHNLFENANHTGYHMKNQFYGNGGESKTTTGVTSAKLSLPSWASNQTFENYKIDEVKSEELEPLVTRSELKQMSNAAKMAKLHAMAEAEEKVRKLEEKIELELLEKVEDDSLISRQEAEMYGLQ